MNRRIANEDLRIKMNEKWREVDVEGWFVRGVSECTLDKSGTLLVTKNEISKRWRMN